MSGKLKINTKEVGGKTGYQAVGSDGTTSKWYSTERSARRNLSRLRRSSLKKKKPVVTTDNESSINPELYGDMLEKKE